jgi:NADPH-dependent curcumin reductase CurA
MHENLQVVYVHPPTQSAPLDADTTFHVVKTPFETDAVPLQPHEVLLKNLYLSIDPYHRFGLYDPAVAHSQFPATTPGTIISTYGISEVVRSKNPEYAPGDIVYAWVRWETFTVVDEANLQYVHTVTPAIDPVYYLGPLGTPGLTGYAGITQVAKPKQGETVVVSATTGAVGMVAAQVAKRLGLTVVGMASSDEKVRYLVDELGLDAAFNYRTVSSLDAALKEHCPDGIDIFLIWSAGTFWMPRCLT